MNCRRYEERRRALFNNDVLVRDIELYLLLNNMHDVVLYMYVREQIIFFVRVTETK